MPASSSWKEYRLIFLNTLILKELEQVDKRKTMQGIDGKYRDTSKMGMIIAP